MLGLQKAAVLGAGQMGSGIAQVLAASGLTVALYDTEPGALKRGLAVIGDSLARFVAKGKMTEREREETVARIVPVTELDRIGDARLVVEAVPERLALKRQLFAELDRQCGPDTIMATNTSSLSITAIAASTRRPDKVIGMHFMNPVPVMALVELVRGLATSDETFAAVKELARKLGKTPVEARDYPGFVSNRLLMPMINEAVYALYEGVASPEDIDAVMRLGMNHPMGPLALADLIGLDSCLAIMETLHDGFGDSKYRPCPLLRNYVQAGFLGRKSGRGFYVYA
ncbi:3-hydroxybutyryl-CoA dehydrogenase [Paenibacillus thailandensis]|jgi:3-hydroxybutyryl-CoA dehydrogenase|uniref:3-hydroxybutyryl-CoA dehydrogenase n=1 Tax=Paenibacillus thailandensis TaxID=393250 RepID=A0ABW5QU80_9BACL